MMRAEDGGVSREVLKVIHDYSHKQIQHLQKREKMRKKTSLQGSRNTDKMHQRRVKLDESWPGRNWRRWMRRSSSKRSRSHSRPSGPETWWGARWRGPVHTLDLTDMKAWSPARTPLSHSWWVKNKHKDRADVKLRSTKYRCNIYSIGGCVLL